jgi:putative hydrolase of the HAD superfamily
MSLAIERRAARERALGLLYEAESTGIDGAAVLAELPVPADPFADALVRAVDEHRDQIDELLERFAEGWTLARMASLDRAALRMGTAELLVRDDVPTGVVLSETVDLAARFGTDGSGRFVNGLLARIARELRPADRERVGEVRQEQRRSPTRSDGVGAAASGSELPGDPQVEGLIVDLDGVIRHWDPSYYEEAEEHLGIPLGTITSVAFADERLARAMDGRTSFADWCAEIGSEVAGLHGVDAALVAETWAEAGWRIDESVLELLSEARQVVPVALLSNASTNLLEDLERSGITAAFDAIVGSAHLGAAKPSEAAFHAAAGALGVPFARCLFVDDTAGHVEAARRLGARAEVFTDVEELAELLRDVGLIP